MADRTQRAMNMVTHAITMNGRIHGELKDRLDSAPEIIRKRLELLDGTNRYALSLWRLPSDVPLIGWTWIAGPRNPFRPRGRGSA